MSAAPSTALPPEARLLLRTIADVADDPEIRELLAGPIDWSALALLAHREQALTVLWDRLRRYPGLVPAAQADQLAQLAMVAEFHLAHLQHRFEQSVAALSAAGFEVMLLKGASLAYTAYRSFVERPMSDVDLLLREPGQARAAQQLLGTVGWDWDRTEDSESFYADHHHLPPLYDRQGGGANMELHTGLFITGHPLLVTAEAFWANARPITVAKSTVYVPHPQDQLLHACLHFAWGHILQTGAWRTFRDVDAIVATGEIDWEAFVKRAEASRGGSCCYWTFDLAQSVGGVRSIPEWVLTRLRPPASRLVRERIRRHLTMMVLGPTAATPSVKLDRFIWEAAIAPDFYGHGTARPWIQEDRWVSENQAALGAPRKNRLLAGMQKVGAYTRYLRTMLTR